MVFVILKFALISYYILFVILLKLKIIIIIKNKQEKTTFKAQQMFFQSKFIGTPIASSGISLSRDLDCVNSRRISGVI